MGNNASRSSTGAYFGAETVLGDLDDNQLKEALRDIQNQRYRELNSKNEQKNLKLKSLIALGSPDPSISFVDDSMILSIGFKSQIQGIFSSRSNSSSISRSFKPSDRIIMNIPISQNENFSVNIQPDPDHIQEFSKDGYSLVKNIVLLFKVTENEHGYNVTYLSQTFQTDDSSFINQINQTIPINPSKLTNVCYFCLQNQPSVAVSECNHNVLCQECSQQAEPHFDCCPICEHHSL